MGAFFFVFLFLGEAGSTLKRNLDIPKVTLPGISSGYRSSQTLSENFKEIEEAFENTISRDGSSPNEMEAILDMNGHRIINTGTPVEPTDLVRLKDVTTDIDGLVEAAVDEYIASGGLDDTLTELLEEEVPELIETLAGKFKGSWNADINVPTIVPSTGNDGDFYVVAVEGTQDINGEEDWKLGDNIWFNGGVWKRVPFQGTASEGYDIPVERFGAKANDAAFDNAPAIQAAENFAAANGGGRVLFRSGAAYYFKDTINITRWRCTWYGQNTRLIYNGANTTRDLIVYGQAMPGPETKGARILGPFIIQSATAMTGGTAFHAKNCVENVFEIEFQTQAGREALGHNLWHGFWGDGIATSTLRGVSLEVQKDGIRINGYATGPKSDMFINVEKIGSCEVGVRVGGGFGGLYLSDQTTLIGNKTHLIVDQTLFAEGNRELFCTGTVFDYTHDTQGEANIIFRDGDILANFTGCWIAGGRGAGLLVESSSVAKIVVDGCRVFLVRSHPSNGRGGDGVRVESSGAYVTITGGQIHANDGWGINPTVVDNVTQFSGVHFWGNTAGEVNPTYGAVIRTHFSPLLSRSLAGWSNVICGAPGNTNFQMKFFDPGNGPGFNLIPVLQFDSEDYFKYTRSTNTLELFISTVPRITVTSIQTEINNNLKYMATTNLDPLVPGQVSHVIVGNTLEIRVNIAGTVKKFVASLT